jgi:hypothetical protein
MNNLLIILILVFFVDFDSKEKSMNFNTYLKKNHNVKLSSEKKYNFLCIITPSCSPCYKYSITKVEGFLKKDSNNYVIFSGNLRKIPNELTTISNARFLIDLNNDYYKYDIFPYDNVVFKIENNLIKNVIKVEPNTIF